MPDFQGPGTSVHICIKSIRCWVFPRNCVCVNFGKKELQTLKNLSLFGCIFWKIQLYSDACDAWQFFVQTHWKRVNVPPFHPPPYRFLAIIMCISLDTLPDCWCKSLYSPMVYSALSESLQVSNRMVLLSAKCTDTLIVWEWRRKKMENLDLNVVPCFGKFYFSQIDSAVCKDKWKYSIYFRGRQRNKWQEGVHLVDGSLEFCVRARHSIRELQSDNLSRSWSWQRTHNS